MKICFISAHSFVSPGGVRNHILNLSKALKENGHHVDILTPNPSQRSLFNDSIDNLTEIGRTVMLPLNGSYGEVSFPDIFHMRKYLKENNYDIIHLHNFLPFISINGLLINSKAKKIMTVHTYPNFQWKHILNKKLIWKAGATYIDHFIFVSESQRLMYKNLDANYSIIPNGIDVNESVEPRSIKDKDFYKILFIGRKDPRKGLPYLIKAFKLLENILPNKIELHIIGVKKPLFSNNTKIKFHGRVDNLEYNNLRKSCDLMVCPATHGESFGIVLLEGMSDGLPIVSFDNPGYRSVLKDKLEKGIAKEKNPQSLAEKIHAILTDDKLYEELSTAGLKQVKQYDWKKVALKIESIYKSLS